MYFYWCNDFCKLNLNKLEKIIWDHFQVYTTLNNLQYDTENFNTYKKMAHLILSLISIDFPVFKDCYLKGEKKIFMKEIKSINFSKTKYQLTNLFNIFINIFKNSEQYNLTAEDKNYLPLVLNILETFISNESHILTNYHSDRCEKLIFTMPFTFPLKLVAEREVDVKNGLVSLPCGKWFSLIEIVYDYFLKLEMTILKKSEELKKIIYYSEDDRIRQIIHRFIKVLFGNIEKLTNNVLKLEEVDLNSQYFPPCMANLHQILRKKHRLSYNSRYQYTLFLKDIGLSVEENILFWKNEYSKPHEDSSCTHVWVNKKNRYIYQIQHLYGLLGTCEIKTSHSCEKFIQDLKTKMDGGCPFQHFTVEKLRNTIPKKLLEIPDIEDLFLYKNSNMPQKACFVYLMCQKKFFGKRHISFEDKNLNINKLNYILSPVQYYTIAKKY